MKNGYFYCGDLLGFSEICTNLTHKQLSVKIDQWVALVEKCAKKHHISKFQLISDTVYAATENNASGLKNLTEFSRELLSTGLKKSLLMRGAITFGKFNWGKLVYGDAVVRAHTLEKLQKWVGVTLDTKIKLSIKDYTKLKVVCYPTPLHQGTIKFYNTVIWDVPTHDELSKYFISGGLFGRKKSPVIETTKENSRKAKSHKTLEWPWGEKLTNTVMYGLYLKIIQLHNLKPDRFAGLLPIDIIEEMCLE